jgi:hypothetical protein
VGEDEGVGEGLDEGVGVGSPRSRVSCSKQSWDWIATSVTFMYRQSPTPA